MTRANAIVTPRVWFNRAGLHHGTGYGEPRDSRWDAGATFRTIIRALLSCCQNQLKRSWPAISSP